MSLTVPLFGDSLREAAKPWLEELGKSDRERLLRLLKLAVAEKTRLSDVLNTLFYGEDTQTALANLTRLRKRLNDAAKGDPTQGGADLGLQFHVDTKKQSPPTERTVWFTGPDEAVMRVTQFSKEASAGVEGKVFIPSKGIATSGSAMAAGKRLVRFFVSYAHEDKTLVDALMKALSLQFKASKGYELQFWTDHDILVGQKWNERILHAIEESDFGLFMVSPAFLGSDYIGENEIPPFVGEGKRKPVIPVGMVTVSFGRHELKGLQENQIFFKGQRTYDHMHRSVDKNDFAHQLFLAIEKRLDTWFKDVRPAANKTEALPDEPDSPELICAEDMQRIMRMPDETRHFQRTRGFAHHLAQREALDSAKASLGDARDALDELEAWAMRTEGSPFFALLGEVGIGKTTTLKQFTRQLIEKRLKEQAKYPLPIYIDLRDYVSDKPETVPTIEELLTSVIQRSWRVTDRTVTAADLLRLVREEGALIVFDGLDEKIVHLTQNRARDFIRTLWSVLPQAMVTPSQASICRGKMLLSCRSHYFRDVWSQNAMLTGEDREGIDRSQYPAFCLLPFDEGQIRGYLTSFLGDEKRGGEAFELIASIHNLRDLAERPYLLSLISGRLGELEALQMRGETVNAARLYDLVVRSWLSRDDGKHHLDAMHKRRLMEALAAALWRSGEKQWDVDRLEEWFDEFLHRNPAIASAYANKDRSLLKEDLRTATFVLRPDTEAKHFRFAHTSLQEYFLASHLFRALAEKADAEWDMPMVSLETLDFLGQILTTNNSTAAISSLERILGGKCLQAAVLAFKYWLEAIKHGHPEPQPKQVNLAGANLEEWHIKGRNKDQPLNLRGANLRRTQFNRARVEFVDLSDADLSALEARQALFLWVNAPRVKWKEANLAGLQWRRGSLLGAIIESDVLEMAELHQVKTSDLSLATTPRPLRAFSSPQIYAGHTNTILACAWNPHGSALISASEDKSLRLWDADTGRELLRLLGHTSDVTCCAWSSSGSQLISGSSDKTLRLWDTTTGSEIRRLLGHTGDVTCCAWSPDGSRVLSSSWDRTLKIWDAMTGRELMCLSSHDHPVNCCAWSPDGRSFISGCNGGILKLWEATTGRELLCFSMHGAPITCCAWNNDGSRLVSGSADNSLKLWDAVAGKEILSFTNHSDCVWCCAWSHDGSRLLSASADNTLKLWNAFTGEELQTLSSHTGEVTCCIWSPDDRSFLSGAHDSTLKIWDSKNGNEQLCIKPNFSMVDGCALSPDNRSVLFAKYDNIEILDAATGKEKLTLGSFLGGLIKCAWSPDGLSVLSAEDDGTLGVWDAVTGKKRLSIHGHSQGINSCDWSPDGRKLLSAGSRSLKVWDSSTGEQLLHLTGHKKGVLTSAWSPDGHWILSGGYDNTIKVWDAMTGMEHLTIRGHRQGIYKCLWSPDGRKFLSRSYDGSMKVWEAINGQQCFVLKKDKGWDLACAWSPDGSMILRGTGHGAIEIWAVATGERLMEIFAHVGQVSACAWSSDGAKLTSGSHDNTLKLWDATTGQCLWTAHNLPENQSAVINGNGTEILHATPEAWRWLGWEERDAKGRFIRRLPAEVFGPIPGMED